MTPQEIMLRLMDGTFDKMSKLPGKVQYRMRSKGWWYGHTSQAWLKKVYPKDAYHRDTVENGSPEWRKDVIAALDEVGLLDGQIKVGPGGIHTK